jgi:hypothetical protein
MRTVSPAIYMHQLKSGVTKLRSGYNPSDSATRLTSLVTADRRVLRTGLGSSTNRQA